MGWRREGVFRRKQGGWGGEGRECLEGNRGVGWRREGVFRRKQGGGGWRRERVFRRKQGGGVEKGGSV